MGASGSGGGEPRSTSAGPVGGDRALYRRLADGGFRGREYALFEAHLVRATDPLLRKWMRLGVIFEEVARRGRPVPYDEVDRARLRTSPDDQAELSGETIAVALVLFRDKAMVGGGWAEDGSASLLTYFTGACALSFPNVYRLWSRERRDWSRVELTEADHEVRSGAPDPADEVAGRQAVMDALEAIPAQPTRELVARMVFNGESQSEAGRAAGLGDRAAEGRVHRLRKEAQRRRGERGES